MTLDPENRADWSAIIQQKTVDGSVTPIEGEVTAKNLRYNRTVFVASCRRCGKTSFALEFLRDNPEAVLIVNSQNDKMVLASLNMAHDVKDRIFSVKELREKIMADTRPAELQKPSHVIIDNYSRYDDVSNRFFNSLAVIGNPAMVVVGIG